jgi:hypothetical protein
MAFRAASYAYFKTGTGSEKHACDKISHTISTSLLKFSRSSRGAVLAFAFWNYQRGGLGAEQSLCYVILEDGTDTLSQNVGNLPPSHVA